MFWMYNNGIQKQQLMYHYYQNAEEMVVPELRLKGGQDQVNMEEEEVVLGCGNVYSVFKGQ